MQLIPKRSVNQTLNLKTKSQKSEHFRNQSTLRREMNAARRPPTTPTTMSAFHLVFVVTSSNFGLKGSAREQGERINIIEVIIVQWEKAMEVE